MRQMNNRLCECMGRRRKEGGGGAGGSFCGKGTHEAELSSLELP